MLCYFITLLFTSRIKIPRLNILKFLVNTLRNHYSKVTFIQVDEYGVLARSSEFMKTCYDMNIIVQKTGGYVSCFYGKSESSNNTLSNITGALLMKSSNNKEPWLFAYQCAIWISCQTENRFRDDVSCFLCLGTRPSYKHIKIWGVIVYIINVRVTRNNIDDISHCAYFVGYAATTRVIIYWDPDQHFAIIISHHVWFDAYNFRLSI